MIANQVEYAIKLCAVFPLMTYIRVEKYPVGAQNFKTKGAFGRITV